jgi:hypothetical protein
MPCFGAFSPNAVAVKSIKNYLRKSFSALVPAVLVKLTLVYYLQYGLEPIRVEPFKGFHTLGRLPALSANI